MMPTESAAAVNVTFIRPSMFYISGFYNIAHIKYYFIFLSFVYAVTILGNSSIMCTIYLTRSLHTAKYVAVFNLAVCDLCGSTALIPKVLDTFLFDHQYITYEACMSYMFFVYIFMAMQSLTLLALAFDRVIAICFPLRYHVIVTKSTMTIIIGVMWIIAVTIVGLTVALLSKLSFCRSVIIESHFCAHGSIFTLACNNNFMSYVMGNICFIVLICLPIILITISYVCIGTALLKISKGGDRIKAMKTCISHLILVAILYLPIFAMNVAALISPAATNDSIFNIFLTQTIPPMLNPIIYTLKTEEVMQAIKALYKRVKVMVTSCDCCGFSYRWAKHTLKSSTF